MSDRHERFAHKLANQVRDETRQLILSVLLDFHWPVPIACEAFGIKTVKQYEALRKPLREAEIMPTELDAALGDGAKITALVRKFARSRYQDVAYDVTWDVSMRRPERSFPGLSDEPRERAQEKARESGRGGR
jgi:hypothetical protein